jgi:hypothetical protein
VTTKTQDAKENVDQHVNEKHPELMEYNEKTMQIQKNVKQFACQFCQNTYGSNNALKAHEMGHHKKCPYCDYKTQDAKENFNQHVNEKCPEQIKYNEKTKQIQKNVKQFVCQVCQNTYGLNIALKVLPRCTRAKTCNVVHCSDCYQII